MCPNLEHLPENVQPFFCRLEEERFSMQVVDKEVENLYISFQ